MTAATPAPVVVAVETDRPTRRGTFLAIGLGAVLLLGGSARVSGPSYHFVKVFGGHFAWGTIFVALGVAMLFAGAMRGGMALRWAYRVAAFGYMLFAVGFMFSAATEPYSGLTGIVVYVWIAYIHIAEGERT